MKFLKSILFSLMFVVCFFTVYACTDNSIQNISFNEEFIELKVGDRISPNINIIPNTNDLSKIQLTSNNSDVVFITGDKQLLAVSIGNAIITASCPNGNKSYLTVKVIDVSIPLTSPSGLRYDSSAHKVIWNSVLNANTYTVELNDEEVLTTANTYFSDFETGVMQTIRVRANSLNSLNNSSFTEPIEFKILSTPTDIQFTKETIDTPNIISWQSENTAFRVLINGILYPQTSEKSFEFPFLDPGEYNVSVVSVNSSVDNNIFKSLPSQEITIIRLPSAENLTWNSQTASLSWKYIENANYSILINNINYNLINNSLNLPTLPIGDYEFVLSAKSSSNFILNNLIDLTGTISITQKLPVPIIDSYNANTKSLTISNFGDAEKIEVYVNDTLLQTSNILTQISATININSDFEDVGEYIIKVKLKGNPFAYLDDSDISTPFIIKRLPAPDNLELSLETFSWNSHISAVKYLVVIEAFSFEVTEPYLDINISDLFLIPGEHSLYVSYIGNDNNILSSQPTELLINKLESPEIEIDYIEKTLTVVNLNNHQYTMTLNSQSYNFDNVYDLSELLMEGINTLSVKIIAQNNEISSDTTEMDIEVLIAPDNLSYDKINEELVFDGSQNANAYVVQIKLAATGSIIFQSTYSNVITSTVNFPLEMSTFSSPREYQIRVYAYNTNNSNLISSLYSAPLTIIKLQPPIINIDNLENINISNQYESENIVAEIKVNDVIDDSVINHFGEIIITTKFVGLGDNYIDSEVSTRNYIRLQTPTNVRLDSGIIKWDSTPGFESNVSVYVKHENNEWFWLIQQLKSTTSYNLTNFFNSQEIQPLTGNFTILVKYIGDYNSSTQQYSYYISSYKSNELIVLRLAPPEITTIEEDIVNNEITINLEHDNINVLKYEIFNGNTKLGETETMIFKFNSQLLAGQGNYNIKIRTVGNMSTEIIGDDKVSTYTSIFSERIVTKLQIPGNVILSNEGVLSWTKVTDPNYIGESIKYNIIIHDYIGENINPTPVLNINTEYLNLNLIPYLSELYNGYLKIFLTAYKEQSSYLKSEVWQSVVYRAAKPTIYSNSTGITFDSLDGENIDFNITVMQNGIFKTAIKTADQYFNLPFDWSAGEYEFKIYCSLKGSQNEHAIDSSTTVLSKNITDKKINLETVMLIRENDYKTIKLVWESVDNVNNYNVYFGTNKIYEGTLNELVLYDYPQHNIVIPNQEFDINITCNVNDLNFFDSQAVSITAKKLKNNSLALNFNDGKIKWNQQNESETAGYHLIINNNEMLSYYIDNANTVESILENFVGIVSKVTIKSIGKLDEFFIDSDYSSATFNIPKLATPTNLTVEHGEFKFIFNESDYNKPIKYEILVGGQSYTLDEEGLDNLSQNLSPLQTYTAKIRAFNNDHYIIGDSSLPISFSFIQRLSKNDTFITTNESRTESYLNIVNIYNDLNWLNNESGDKLSYQIQIFTNTEIIREFLLEADSGNDAILSYVLPSLTVGVYYVRVKVLGSTEVVHGESVLSSAYSNSIEFRVLETPTVIIINGILTWNTVVFAENYIIYYYNISTGVFEGIINAGNNNSHSLSGLFNNGENAVEKYIKVQAIGNGIYGLASNLMETTSTHIIKPRAPGMLSVDEGGLHWEGLYTYYTNTNLPAIYLEFRQNDIIKANALVNVTNFMSDNKWPYNENYLQKIINGLNPGKYKLYLKQIGDNTHVISSEYTSEYLELNVAPTPKFAKIRNHTLSWYEATLPNFGSESITYIVYVYDSSINDWSVLDEVTTLAIEGYVSYNLSNITGNILPSYTKIAIAVKGNSQSILTENDEIYITGNMCAPINIKVLNTVSNLQTTVGVLTWSQIDDASSYEITAMGENALIENANKNVSILNGWASGEYEVLIRAIGNGTNIEGLCTINGYYSDVETFTKLDIPSISTNYGEFVWEEIAGATLYNIYVDGTYYKNTTNLYYISDINNTSLHSYNFQSIGNSQIPTINNIAYVSSDISYALIKKRLAQISNLEINAGVLSWKSESNFINPRFSLEYINNDGSLIKLILTSSNYSTSGSMGNIVYSYNISNILNEEGNYNIYVCETIYSPEDSSQFIKGLSSNISINVIELEKPEQLTMNNGKLVWNAIVNANKYIVRIGLTNYEVSIVEDPTNSDLQNYTIKKVGDSLQYNYTLEKTNECIFILEDSTIYGTFDVSVKTYKPHFSNEIYIGQWSTSLNNISTITSIALNQLTITIGNETTPSQIKWLTDYLNLSENFNFIIKYEDYNNTTGYLTNIQEYEEWSFVNLIDGIKTLQIKTVPSSNLYFSSTYSEDIFIGIPAQPTVSFDRVSQTFHWNTVEGANKYIIEYQIGQNDPISKTVTNNVFIPMVIGNYALKVRAIRNKIEGESEDVGGNFTDLCSGEFNLFSSGNGSQSSPYRVKGDNIQNIQYRSSSYFSLFENIEYSGSPIGFDYSIFTGNFNGAGNTITLNFNFINGLSTTESNLYLGLFQKIHNAKITNLKISFKNENALTYNNLGNYNTYFGGIAGYMSGTSLIENCSLVYIGNPFILNIKINPNSFYESYFGGLIGYAAEGSVKDSQNNLNLNGSITNSYSFIGGIVGKNENATVDNCTNLGSIENANTIGGIVAYNRGRIQNCINDGNITSSTASSSQNAGGIVGFNDGINSSSDTRGKIINNTNNAIILASGEGTSNIGQITGHSIFGHHSNNTLGGSPANIEVGLKQNEK